MPDLSFVPILLLAALVHGVFGFGFPLVATPLLALFFDLPTAILLTLLPTVSINLVSILGERHWREALHTFWPIPTFTIIGSFLGTQVLLAVDPAPFRVLLALVLIGYLISDHLHRSERPHHVPPWGMALFGLSLGLLAGVVNVFAPLLVVYALYTRMNPVLMVATFNLSFLTSKSGQIAGYVYNQAFDLEIVMLTVWTIPLLLLVLWLGIRLRRRVRVETYKRLLRLGLWLASLLLIMEWLRQQFY